MRHEPACECCDGSGITTYDEDRFNAGRGEHYTIEHEEECAECRGTGIDFSQVDTEDDDEHFAARNAEDDAAAVAAELHCPWCKRAVDGSDLIPLGRTFACADCVRDGVEEDEAGFRFPRDAEPRGFEMTDEGVAELAALCSPEVHQLAAVGS